MQQQNDILIYILEHLGLPLMQASSVLNAQDKKADVEACASTMAKLLSAAVQLGMAYSGKLNVPSDPDKGEIIRFKLTSLAAEALLGRISLTKKELAETDIDILKSSSDSLLAFSDNFSLNERALGLLKSLELDLFSGDEISYLHMVEAMLPVIECVNAKSLEGDATQLIQQIVGILHTDSQELVSALVGETNTDIAAQKAFSVLAKVFAATYRDAVIQKQSLAFVQERYATQKDLALVLLKYLVTGQTQSNPSSQGPAVQTTQQPETTSPSPPLPAQEVGQEQQQPAPLPPQSEEPEPQIASSGTAGSPSIFSAPSGQGTSSTQTSVSQTPQEQQITSPPSVDTSQPSQKEDTSDDTDSEAGGSPLSFFKKSDS